MFIADKRTKRNLFYILSFFASLFLFWQIWSGQESTNLLHYWPVIVILSVLTCLLVWWVPNPVPKHLGEESVFKSRYRILVVLFAVVFFALPLFIGPYLLWLLPISGITILLVMRARLHSKELTYAFILAATASILGYAAGWITQLSPMTWSIMQFFLVFTGCLTGWHLIHHSGLHRIGIGKSCFLEKGIGEAIRQFMSGFLIGIPWALSLVILGGARTETWVQEWWHPFIAMQPAISEEAWARLLLVPLVYILVHQIYKPRTAYTVSLLIVGYWFAYLHTIGTEGVLLNTIFTGTLYALPTSFLCLNRNYESAVGFHFSIDFIKFYSAYIMMNVI